MSPADVAVRAMTNDGGFRVIAATTTETVRGVVASQRVAMPTAGWLADLVTGTALIRETMAPTLRTQGILKSADGRGRLVADSHPDGGSRGLVQAPDGSGPDGIGEGSALEMMRTLPNGALQRGIVEVSGKGGLSAALMTYLSESEQVLSMVAVGHIERAGEIEHAGGYLVQLLPELTDEMLAVMTDRIQRFETIDQVFAQGARTPEQMLDALLRDMPFTRLSESPLSFKCRCDDVRIMTTLATLPRAEIEELLRDGETLEISCEYCHQEYRVAPERLRGLLARS